MIEGAYALLMSDNGVYEVAATCGMVLGLIGLVLAVAALGVVIKMRTTVAELCRDADGESLLEMANRNLRQIDGARADIVTLRGDLERVIRNVSLVRYDAFPGAAGRTSFSAALLDNGGDGVVLTAINGRSETRTYAKSIIAGASTHDLSPEEMQAIEEAMDGLAPQSAVQDRASRPEPTAAAPAERV